MRNNEEISCNSIDSINAFWFVSVDCCSIQCGCDRNEPRAGRANYRTANTRRGDQNCIFSDHLSVFILQRVVSGQLDICTDAGQQLNLGFRNIFALHAGQENYEVPGSAFWVLGYQEAEAINYSLTVFLSYMAQQSPIRLWLANGFGFSQFPSFKP